MGRSKRKLILKYRYGYLLYDDGANINCPAPDDMPLKLHTHNEVDKPNKFLINWEKYSDGKKIKRVKLLTIWATQLKIPNVLLRLKDSAI